MAWDERRVNKRWPATILAANRTDSVIGRITFLTISIKTMNGINAGGVPMGTKCANMSFGKLNQAYITCPTHNGIAKENAKVKCAVEVKM